jgi:hypothetical protein
LFKHAAFTPLPPSGKKEKADTDMVEDRKISSAFSAVAFATWRKPRIQILTLAAADPTCRILTRLQKKSKCLKLISIYQTDIQALCGMQRQAGILYFELWHHRHHRNP